jgi:hypothetical protein
VSQPDRTSRVETESVTAARVHAATEVDEIPPAQLSQAVIVALANAEAPLTVRDIEAEVGRLLAKTGPAPVEHEVKALEALEIVRRSELARSYSLTDRGREFASGIAILARA